MSETQVMVAFASWVLEKTKQETQHWKQHAMETGGIWLLQEVAPGNYLARDYVAPGPNARRGPGSFEPDVDYQNSEICRKQAGDPALRVIAPWHSHPDWLGTPSPTDQQAARGAIATWDLPKPELLIGIAIAPDGNFSLRTFHMTGKSDRFREIPWTIGEDRQCCPSVDAPRWIDLEAGRDYLRELLAVADRRGFKCRAERSGNEIHISFNREDQAPTARLKFPAGFPFAPAWFELGSCKRHLSVDRENAVRSLKRALRRASKRPPSPDVEPEARC
jgi:hypothetical protein